MANKEIKWIGMISKKKKKESKLRKKINKKDDSRESVGKCHT